MNTAERFLAHLRKWGPNTQSQLALLMGIPEPSVRRLIQQLRHLGYNITFTTGRNACYTLIEKEQTYGREAETEHA